MWTSSVKMKPASMSLDIRNNRCTTGQPSSRLSSHNAAMTSLFLTLHHFGDATVEKAVKYCIPNTQWVLWKDKFVSLLSLCNAVFPFLSHSSEMGHHSHVYSSKKCIFSCFRVLSPMSLWHPFSWADWLQIESMSRKPHNKQPSVSLDCT